MKVDTDHKWAGQGDVRPHMESFRIPPSALRRQYTASTAILIVGGGLAAYAWKGVVLPIDLFILVILFISFGAFVAYLVARKKIWVVLSKEGIRGKGMNGREVALPWSAPVLPTPMAPPNVGALAGMTLLATSVTGVPSAKGVFIPRGILRSSEFAAAVERLSPVNHPLRRLLFNMA